MLKSSPKDFSLRLNSGGAIGAIVAGCMLAMPAQAQTAAGSATAQDKVIEEDKQDGIAVIVVTAQRREESLQDVPVSITALTSDAITSGAIRGVEEIAGRTPSFTMTAFNVAQPRLFIRGSGSTDDGAAQDNSVAVFMDDVYIARGSGQAFEFLDIERIEVLRGPQGTLYGKNVVGGLVNVISRRPAFRFEGAGEVSYGNYNALDLRGYVSGPVTDTLAASLSGVNRSRDGFARNIRLDRDLEDLEVFALRGQLLWTPSPNVDVLLSADYSNHSDNGQSRKGEGPFTTPLFGSVTNVQTTDNPRESESPRITYQDREIFGTLGRIDWRSDLGTLTSITAYRESEVSLGDAFTGIGSPPYPVLDTLNIEQEEANQFSQEVRFATDPFLNDRLTAIVGLYYLKENVDRTEIADLISAIGSAVPALGGLTGVSGSYQLATTESLGAFASATLDVTDRLGITAGIRYTHETKDVDTSVVSISDIDGIIAAPPTEEYAIAAKESWDGFTPRVALTYEVNPALNLYLSYAKGFKSGGFQGQAPTGAAASTPFDPEYAESWEAGVKGQLFNRRVTFALSAHNTNYEDLQVRQNAQRPGDPLPILRITNAGAARARGIELDINVKPVPWLTLWGSYGYLDAEYVELIDNTGADRAGNNMVYAPENTFNVGGEIEVPVGERAELFARADYRWQDEFFFDPSNDAVNTQEGYGLLNASAGLNFGAVTAEVWAKNLTDKLYRTSNVPFLGDRFVTYGAPRTYGVRLRFNF